MTVNWIYLGNSQEMTNPSMNRGMSTDQRNAVLANAKAQVGTVFDYTTLKPVAVDGSPLSRDRDHFEINYTKFSYDLGNGTVTSAYSSHVRYVVEVTLVPKDGGAERIQRLEAVVFQTKNGDKFIRPYAGTEGQWRNLIADASIKSVELTSVSTAENATNPFSRSDAGYDATIYREQTIVPCFVEGTFIRTPQGDVPVEALKVGDVVSTRDRGAQPIRWIGSSTLSALHLRNFPNLHPIRVEAGALGTGMPTRDLMLSPQHRLLLSSPIVQRMFDKAEVLVAVKQLSAMSGIQIVRDDKAVTYYHILLDRHEILYANDAMAESLFTGPVAMKAISSAAYEEICAIFPEITFDDYVPMPARFIPDGRSSREAARRHIKNARKLVSAINP